MEHRNMPEISRFNRLAIFLLVWTVGAGAAGFTPHARAAGSARPAQSAASPQSASPGKAKPDLSGGKRVGKASFYARKLTGRKMADGAKMNPHNDNAASKTLPLGTTAKVTNLETRQSAVVTIQDRGPHVKDRIVDLSPSTAQKIGIDRDNGVAKVEVAPIAVPLPDGSVKPGVAAQEAETDKRTSGDRSE
jgi:rare lipoprotein A